MSTKGIICCLILALSLLFKFWLIAEMEITDDADDAVNYLSQILLNHPSFYGPGTGWAGKLFYLLGIPFRDGIEVLYLLSCLLVVKALFTWPTKSYLALGLFLFVAFNPAPEELFSHLMSDQVWLVEVLLGLSLYVAFADTPTRLRCLYLVLAAVSLGLSTLTRTTLVPLVASFLLWGLLGGILCWLKKRRKAFDLHSAIGIVVCLAFIGILNDATCFYNSIHYGYFGLSVIDSREYRDFYLCLQSVGDPTGDPYYPVDDHRLGLVAQAGPVSHRFVDQMRTDRRFRTVSRQTFGKYDFSLGWFHFIVFADTFPNGNLPQGFAMFRAVESEIAQASADNRLKVRHILPLPDCRLPIVLSVLPDAMRDVSALITVEPSRYAWAWAGEPKFDNAYFSLALTRRTVVPSPLRENIGRALCVFYSIIYPIMLPGLILAVSAYLACGVYFWKKISAFSLRFLARQLFGVLFVVLFCWYAFFHASGFPAFARYMIYQNVMLPVLLVYYGREAWCMVRGHDSLTRQPPSGP